MDKHIRFWKRVNKTASCWEWQGARNKTGYGTVCFNYKTWRTHRYAWHITYGSIPVNLCVLHHCDNPPCVNPDHLWLGTHADNVRDRENKGRGVYPKGRRKNETL